MIFVEQNSLSSRTHTQTHTWVNSSKTDLKQAFPTSKGRELDTMRRRCCWPSDWSVVSYRRLVTWTPLACAIEPAKGERPTERLQLATTPTSQLIHKALFPRTYQVSRYGNKKYHIISLKYSEFRCPVSLSDVRKSYRLSTICFSLYTRGSLQIKCLRIVKS